jgi:hypothetical protein
MEPVKDVHSGIRLLDHSDRFSSETWETEEALREAMYYFEHHLNLEMCSPDWMLVKGAFCHLYSVGQRTTFGEALQFAKETLSVRDELHRLGFDHSDVDCWMSCRNLNLKAGIEYLSKPRKQRLQEYDAAQEAERRRDRVFTDGRPRSVL